LHPRISHMAISTWKPRNTKYASQAHRNDHQPLQKTRSVRGEKGKKVSAFDADVANMERESKSLVSIRGSWGALWYGMVDGFQAQGLWMWPRF